jgi:DNA polymerase
MNAETFSSFQPKGEVLKVVASKKVQRAEIDFETRSSLELKLVGAYRYAQDVSTRALCLAYKLPNQPVKLWHPGLDDPYDLFFWIEDGGMVEAHNAEFEYVIWNMVQRKAGWPALPWEQLICSAAKSAAMGLPRALDSVCDALDTVVKKDQDGKKIMLRLSKLKKPTHKDPDCFDDDPEKRQKLYAYCIDDVRAEIAVSEMLPDLQPRYQKFWRLTSMINERGIYCDVDLCRIAYGFAKRFEIDIQRELKIITKGAVSSAKQTAKFKDYLQTLNVTIPDLKAQTVDTTLQTELPVIAKRMLQIRQQINRSSVSKFSRMLSMAGSDKRIRGTILFFGASTGRDAGRGIQPQNYPRGLGSEGDKILAILALDDYELFKGRYPNVFEALSNCLRGMLRAAPGKTLLAADFAGIEARGVMWLAGQDDALTDYANGVDQYKKMAANIYDIPIAEVDKDKRFLGKQSVLGSGYGMGKDKFQITCAGYGVEVPIELCEKAVKTYRSTFYKVPQMWRNYEQAAINATERPGRVFKTNKCSFYVLDNFLYIVLPSGRKLAYQHPMIVEKPTAWGDRKQISFWGVNAKTKKMGPEFTYGGKITENICQAVSFDLMIEACARHEMNGFPTVMRVHDELIAEVDDLGDDENKLQLNEHIRLMKVLPAWAEGFPIDVEGHVDVRYRK